VYGSNSAGAGLWSAASNGITTPLPSYLSAWGHNYQGELGLNTTGNAYSSPKQVGALTNWLTVSSGNYHTTSVKSDGTLWSWGSNFRGALGLNSATTYYSSPKQVGALTNWASSSAGYYYVLATKTDGSLWAWGYNGQGRLGLGNNSGTTSYSSPAQVGTLTNWLIASAGYNHAVAIKTDGTLWTWGLNSSGQLGLGNTTSYSSPKQVGNLTNWSNAIGRQTHNLAIKTDGTLWAWGWNLGALGLGNTTNYSSPVQVGSGTNWSKISTNTYVSFAIKTDGTLWSWGQNNFGQLGQGTSSATMLYSSPKQVGALTTWSRVSNGIYNTVAIRTDGTLWAWGRNLYGELGLGNITNYSSPRQVGALTYWINVACSEEDGSRTFAIHA